MTQIVRVALPGQPAGGFQFPQPPVDTALASLHECLQALGVGCFVPPVENMEPTPETACLRAHTRIGDQIVRHWHKAIINLHTCALATHRRAPFRLLQD